MKVNEECVRGPSSQPFKVKSVTKYAQKGAGSAELFDRAGQGFLTVSLRTRTRGAIPTTLCETLVRPVPRE